MGLSPDYWAPGFRYGTVQFLCEWVRLNGLGGPELILERETGLEPATSSLGNYATIVNKELMRSWH